MAYTKIAKPRVRDFLLKQDAGYLLLQNGGKIILRKGWDQIAKPIAVYTKIAKPAIP